MDVECEGGSVGDEGFCLSAYDRKDKAYGRTVM